MTNRNWHEETPPAPARRRGGAQGPRKRVRTAIDIALVIVAIIVLKGATTLGPRLRVAGAFTLALVAVDVVMLWRGDLDYTHFESKRWSYRINAVLAAFAVGFLVASFVV